MSTSYVSDESIGDVDPPDVGWIAAVGVYAGIVLAAAGAAIAATAGVGGATIVGSLSTAITIGLVGGAIGAGRAKGLPERVGRGLPWLAAPFLAPLVFAVATAVVLVTSVADIAAIATGIGAFLSGVLAVGLVGMGRTRYARAMVSDDPIVTVDRLAIRQPLYMAGWGAFCLVFAAVVAAAQSGPFLEHVSVQLVLMGSVFLLMGWSTHVSLRRRTEDAPSGWYRFLPDRIRRSKLGSELIQQVPANDVGTNELAIHREGIVVTQPLQRRFLPWTAIADISLTEMELRFRRERWFDLRCHRSVIDDPEGVYEKIASEVLEAATDDSV